MTSRDLQVIGEHTVDVSLLTPGGWVLDAGCRDFTFARGCAKRGCFVSALDADPTIADPNIPGVLFECAALVAKPVDYVDLIMTTDPQARFVGDNPQSLPSRRVRAMTIKTALGGYVADAVKLDIEGSEYDILANWPGPIAKQVSVEFHEHVEPRSAPVYRAIMDRMFSFGYELVQHEKTARHCCAPNFWDTLWVLR